LGRTPSTAGIGARPHFQRGPQANHRGPSGRERNLEHVPRGRRERHASAKLGEDVVPLHPAAPTARAVCGPDLKAQLAVGRKNDANYAKSTDRRGHADCAGRRRRRVRSWWRFYLLRIA